MIHRLRNNLLKINRQSHLFLSFVAETVLKLPISALAFKILTKFKLIDELQVRHRQCLLDSISTTPFFKGSLPEKPNKPGESPSNRACF